MCSKKKTPESSLFEIFENLQIEQYKKTVLQERYLTVLNNFHQRSKTLSLMFYTTRIIVTVGSILVPAFLSIQGSTYQMQIYWTTWILSILVTISNGFMTLFKIDKKYFFIHTTLELLYSEGWQYVGLSGRYAGKDGIPPTHENQFLVFFHMSEKIKMRQVEEEYWKFTDTSGVGNATNQKTPMITQTPLTQQGNLRTLPQEQKDVLEQWVGEMKSNTLGLQPRQYNNVMKIDERSGSLKISESPGISTNASESAVSMRPTLQESAITRESMVQSSPTTSSEIPENTIVKELHEKPNEWV